MVLHSMPIGLRRLPTSARAHRTTLSRAAVTRPPARRWAQSSGPFEPLRPPTPGELGAPRRARDFQRGRRWTRRLLYAGAVGGAAYLLDREVYGSGLARTLRTLATMLLVALDYKLNFRPAPLTGGSATDVHGRSAERLFDLLRANGGLYLKIGQAIAMQSAVLPPAFQRMFSRMFDDAPQDGWKEVEKVIRQDFGKSVEEVFGVSFRGEPGRGVMERKARASASVAQVHWARLADGREVAIKIQKREIAKQMAWDLWAFRTVAWIYSRWFEIPFYSLVPYITQRLALETDFINEARNSDTMRALVDGEKRLKGRVYIPAVHHELTTRRVLTTEWIEGVRLWDKEAMTSPWLGPKGEGSPGARSGLAAPDMEEARRKARSSGRPEARIKPERLGWRGRRGEGGLGVSAQEVMTTMIDLFSAQIFRWGVVHCDPHPGNIFIRRLPGGRAELVLIDHGLYVYMSAGFRDEYATFWRALVSLDNRTVARVTEGWGIKGAELFASATLLRPYEGGGGGGGGGRAREERARALAGLTEAERQYALQQRMKQGVREVLADESKWPRELLFIGRNMRIVQGNNQYLGSPVNRVKRMGRWAASSAGRTTGGAGGWAERAWRRAVMEAVLAGSDAAFYLLKLRRWLVGGGAAGMEEEMERRVREAAQAYGIELQHDVFEG